MAVVLTILVVAGAAFQVAPLVYAGTPAHDSGFSLHQPFEYLFLAPIVRLLDELSLLTDRQHIEVLSSAALVAVVWACARACLRAALSARARICHGARAIASVAAATVLLYVVGALVPRPMVALRSANPADVLVDFHSHTHRSHDGRWGFDVESNRAWHGAAGFNAVYVTDHQTMAGWQVLADHGALQRGVNRVREASLAGTGAVSSTATILPGIETVVPGAHLNLLGVSSASAPLFRHARDLDTAAFAMAPAAGRPLVLLTLPFDLGRSPGRAPRIDAIEISNGSPRGLGFARLHRTRILSLADSLRVPVVASSNNHGWGATAVGWTALRLERWQAMSPLALDEQIRATIIQRPEVVRVVERSALALSDGRLEEMLAVPRLIVHILRIAHPLERVSFAVWIWAIWLIARRRTSRRLLGAHAAAGLAHPAQVSP
ncbi:MAG: hypothetical protein Q8K82_23010 [Gemmatimonadaceae bacterium]|nr:hypothetical protein [Gemmatimonadaceae bacterium]